MTEGGGGGGEGMGSCPAAMAAARLIDSTSAYLKPNQR